MAACAKCGATLGEGATFCGSCGTPVGGAAGGPAPAAAPTSGPQSNVLALVAYLTGGIAGIFFAVSDQYKSDKFLRFHSFQSIFYGGGCIAIWIVYFIISLVLSFITAGLAGLILLPISILLWLAMVVGAILLMVKAFNNERFMFPVIGPMAAKYAG